MYSRERQPEQSGELLIAELKTDPCGTVLILVLLELD